MANATQIIFDSLHHNQTRFFSIKTDTAIHKVFNIPQRSGTKWTEYLKPSIDLLIALIGAFVLVWKYLTQKQKESDERIIESKRSAYSEFLNDFTDTAINITYYKNTDGIKADKRRINARNLLLLYGNDGVVKAYNNWVDYTDESEVNHGSDKDVELFGEILIEIRKDLHGDSKVTKDEIKNLNPFHRG
jgi:hypothetical protein